MKNQIKILVIILCFLVQVNVHSQGDNTLLWSISGNGIKNSYFYLTGASCDAKFSVSEQLKIALANTNTISVEYDLYGKDAQKLSTFNFATSEGEMIKSNISNGEYLKLLELLKDYGYPENALASIAAYKLPVGYMLLTSINNACGKTRPVVYEREMKLIASQYKQQFSVLQSVDSVIHEMKMHSNSYWVENIKYMLSNQDIVKGVYQKELDLFKAQNIGELSRLYSNQKLFSLQYSDNVLKYHTQFLTTAIEKQMNINSTLFSIHFSNIINPSSSVFQLLRAKGYKISPVL
jgi:hypothetical protein